MSSGNHPVTKHSAAFPPSNVPIIVAEKIVESRNLFLTSDDLVPSQGGNGQMPTWNFGNQPITTRSPAQYIRLTLLNFNMYKTWTNVNVTNNMVFLKIPGHADNFFQLDSWNYSTVHDVAQNFGDKFKAAIDTALGTTCTLTIVSPPAGALASGTTNNIIQVRLDDPAAGGVLPSAANVLAGTFQMICPIDTDQAPFSAAIPVGIQDACKGGDSAILLGADRIGSADITATPGIQSFNIDTDAAQNFIIISGFYPAQRFVEPNVYIRCNPAPDTLASDNMEKVQTLEKNNNNMSASPILAEIKQQDEMVQYTTPGEGHFFANFYTKSLNTLQLEITDSKNRQFPVYTGNQTTRGNRYFTCNFRADIVMDTAYGETPDPQAQKVFLPHNYPPRFDSNVLVNQPRASNYGRPPAY